MVSLEQIVHLVARDDGSCTGGNDYTSDNLGARISAIFVILVGSLFGATFPVFAHRNRGVSIPAWVFFIAKYFGSGVIVATAFIHLLAPASDGLTQSCLSGAITEYDWAEGIALMTIFVMFFLELMTMRYAKFGAGHNHDHEQTPADGVTAQYADAIPATGLALDEKPNVADSAPSSDADHVHTPGNDHLGHSRTHVDNEDVSPNWADNDTSAQMILPESYSAMLTAVFILEFGVIFHSIFIGLTLAVAGAEFATLYVVLIFHQTFEGLGLGTRLAAVPWPRIKRWTPYFLGAGYAISTPVSIAIGLGLRESYPPNSTTTIIVNGVFDSISAGILIYTGLVELMAHEFMFSSYMQRASIKTVLFAFGSMCAGAGLMALLGKWA